MPLYVLRLLYFYYVLIKDKKIKERDCTPYIFLVFCGERGSRTYAFKKYHKIANH